MKKTLKRSISFVLAFMIVFSMLTVLPSELFHSTYVHAAEAIAELAGADPEIYENDDFTYTLTDEYTKVRIMSCKLDSDEIVIPDTIDGKKVTSIGPNAFQGSSITSIIMGKNIETICEYAFANCTKLSSVDFGDAVKSIGECSFARTVITELNFPDSLETIGNNAFSPYSYGTWGDYSESQLQSVTFGANLKTIGSYAFYYNKKLAEVNFTGSKLTSIGYEAFYDCDAITSLEITGDKATIDSRAFQDCGNLETVTLSGVENLNNNYVFYNCAKLKTFTADNSLKTIGNNAFQYDKLLETANIGTGVTSIGSYAFDGCNALTSIAIPDGVTSIPDYAFRDCNSMETLSIGGGVNNISKLAFINNGALQNISVASENESFKSIDNVVYSKDGKTLVLFKKSMTGEYRIANGVETVAPYAFQNCQLSKVIIPGSVNTVSEYAFQNSPNLAEVVFEDSEVAEKTIGNYAFANCTKLSSVDFGNAVKSIGECSFARTVITELNFPDSLETIGNNAFSPYSYGTWGDYSESQLQSVTFGANLKTIGSYAFYYNKKLAEVNFTGSKLTSIGYEAFYDCDAITSLEITGDKATIDSRAFQDCGNLETVTLSGVENLNNNYVFYNCAKLKTFTADNSLKTIGNNAFQYDKLLETANIGTGVTSIGSYAFDGCNALTSIAIPDGVTSIPDYAFRDCNSLETVSVGSGVNSISGTAFMNTTSLSEINVSENNSVYASMSGVLYNKAMTEIILSPKNKEGEIIIPDTVTTIKDYAFQNSPNLTSVVIGKNVETVGSYAFSGCPNLESVTFKNNSEISKTIGNYAFADCTKLSSVDFGNAVKSIGSYAFRRTAITELDFPDSLETIAEYAFTPYYDYSGGYFESKLQSINFGANLKTIGYHAFRCNHKLTEVNITGGALKTIASNAFYNCNGLTSVVINGDNATIQGYAFDNCDNLETITLSGVATIESNDVFYNCAKLKTFTADNSLKTIGNYAFQGDKLLETANIGTGVTSIGSYAFDGCNALTSIAIPDGVTTISDCSFRNCSSLETLSIGSGVKSIYNNAFINAGALTNITVSAANETFKSVDNVLYTKDGKTLVLFKKGMTGEYTIPDGVETISPYAFQNCKLSKITIPGSVKTVSQYAFQNCPNLAEVVFEDREINDRTIDYYAFANCPKLSSVDFGNSVKDIGESAFRETALTEIIFPENLETIGQYAFYNNKQLVSVTFAGSNLTRIGYEAFYNCDALTNLEINGNNAVIENYAFENCDKLKNVTLNGVATIRYDAFAYCRALETVNMSNDVKTIESDAFYSCSALKEVVLSKNLESAANRVFTGYSNMTVYCYEDTYSHEYALTLNNVEIKFILDNYYVTNLRAVNLASQSATFAWGKPKGFDNIDHYIISKNGVKYDETNSLSYTDTGLAPGETYTYGVKAVDSDGIISEEKTLEVTTACTSVERIVLPNNDITIGGLFKVKLTAVMENNLSKSGATAKFTYSADGETWSDACTASVLPDGVSYVGYWDLKDVRTGEYMLRFTLTDKDGGESFKDTQVIVDRTHPAAIDEVTVTPLETSINLAWQISKEYDTRIYRIYRKASNEDEFELISEIRNRNTTTYSDKNVEEGVTYEYYVVGTDSFGQESLTYEIVSAGIIDDSIAPAFTSIYPASNNFIYGSKKFTVNATDNVGVTKIELYYSQDSTVPNEEWTLFASHNGSVFDEYVDTSVIPDGEVFVKAKIYDANNNFVFSPAYRYYSDNTGPEKVQNVTCVQAIGTIVTLSWDEISDNDLHHYVVEVQNSNNGWDWAAQTSSTNGVNIKNLKPETEYTYRVVGYDKFNNRGVVSDPITVTTAADTEAPLITSISPQPGYYNNKISLQIYAKDDYRVTNLTVQTSTDKNNWSNVANLTADNPSTGVNFRHELSLANYEEGSLFVRGIAKDSYGNTTPTNEATVYEYVVDRTAPAVPVGISAASAAPEDTGSCYVNVSWNPVTDDDSFSYYNVYRSDSENGDYTLIKGRLNTVNTYDNSVEYGKTYFYKVEAVDKAGNVSEKSAAVSCKVKDDEEAPVIYSVSPVSGTYIGAKNSVISVAASDNARLDTLKVEYKTNGLFSSFTTLREVTGNAKNNCEIKVTLPIEELDNETEVTLKITASDASGNQAEEKTVTYMIDKEAAEIKDLELTKTEDNIYTASWTTDDEDVSYFYVYKKTANDSDYTLYDSVMAQTGKTSYSYTDEEITLADRSVGYKIESYDRAGNTAFAETVILETSGTVRPTAVILCQSSMVFGSEYIFEATASFDDLGITCYEFNFGDGSAPVVNSNGVTTHVYSEQGEYTLSLTVTDTDGNTDTVRKQISVTGRELINKVYVTVKDDKGNVLPNTDVYADLGETNQMYARTNSSGMVSFELSVGTHIISSYKNSDYLPIKRSIAVTGSDMELTLVLINEPIVTGEFEIHKMTFDEIVAAGIDINAAENRNVVKINVTLIYEAMPIKSQIIWNGREVKADPIYVKSSNGSTHKLTPFVLGGGGGGCGYGGGGYGGGGYGGIDNPTVVYIDVPVEFSYLKEFFDVKLHILNHASEDFSLLDSTVKLNVPDGLTIVNTNYSTSNPTIYIGEIQGQSQKTVSWVLRGDKPGVYDISADFLGMLSYFNEPISAKFIADEPITVQDTSSINITVEASQTTHDNTVFYNTVIENTGNFALEAFEWVPLIESFVDEFVDSSGHSYEMTEQRTTLNPGEKFIYHYSTDLNGMYRYIGNMVDEMNSNGANVKVVTFPVEHFLNYYLDKYPEEGGNFVFYVKHRHGESLTPIEGAKVKLTDTAVFTTDSQGCAIVPSEQRKSIKTNSIIVSANGYYDYNGTFGGLQYGKSETIELYCNDDFSIKDVKLDGKSAMTSNCKIVTNDKDQNGNTKNLTFLAEIYGDIDTYDIYQNGKAVAAVSKNANKTKHLYQIVCAADSFVEKQSVEIRAKNKNGDEIVELLKIKVVTIDFDIDVQLPGDSFSMQTDNDEYEWLKGLLFNFKICDLLGLSYVHDYENDTVTFGVNVSKTVWEKVASEPGNGFDNAYGTFKHGKDVFSDLLNEIRDQYEKASGNSGDSVREKFNAGKWGSPKINIFAQGALSFKINDDGKLEYQSSKIYIGASFGIGYSTNFIIGPVPFTAGVDASISGGFEGSFTKKSETYNIASMNFKLSGILTVNVGIGISLASIGVYGSTTPAFDFVIVSNDKAPGLETFTLSGELGFYIKALFFETNFKIFSGSWKIFDRSAKNGVGSVGDAYNPDSYTINDDILSYNPYWASPVATSVGTTTMLDNAYSGTPAQIAVCGNKAVMVYQGVDRNADNVANALALYYSVYNPETMNWSVPKKLDSNQQADIDFTLVSNGDKAYVLYTQANSELSEDIGILDVTKKIDVYSAEFDSSTETFSGFDRLTNDESYDTIPVIKTIGGSPTAVWTSNSEGSPFLSEGTNSIKLSKLENGEWSAPQTVVSTEDAIINCDVVASDRTPVVVYTTDADDDLVTADDRNLYVLNTANNESQTIAQGVTSAVEIGELMGNNVVMWYDNGEMKQYNAKTSVITSIDGIPSAAAKEFKIASDENGNNALVFVSEGTIYAKYLNTETGSWSEPIAVASSENNIENISAEYVNGKLNVTYYDTKVTDSESMATQSDLKTAVAANTPKPEITSASVDHENLVLGQEAEMQVTVRNSSSAPTGNLSFTVTNYDGTVLGSFTTENVSLNAGESQDFVVPFTVPDDIVNRDVKVTVTDSTKTGVSSKNVKLAVVDYGVNASQIYDGDKEYIKAVVYNNTNYTSPATLEVYNRFTDEVLYSTNISKVEKNYPVTAKIEIDNSYIDKNGYISVRIVTKAEDSFETDNTDMFQYIPKDAFDTPDLLIGDVNLDGEVDINDATEISKYLVNLITLEGKALATADVNGDADIDINDVTCIQKYLAKFTSYGNCGQKLTSRV